MIEKLRFQEIHQPTPALEAKNKATINRSGIFYVSGGAAIRTLIDYDYTVVGFPRDLMYQEEDFSDLDIEES